MTSGRQAETASTSRGIAAAVRRRPKISPAIHWLASSCDMPCIAANAGPMSSSDGSSTGQNSAPVAATAGASSPGAATIT
jgi:hypothetical protein